MQKSSCHVKNNHSFKFNSPDIPRNFPLIQHFIPLTSYHSISYRAIQLISQTLLSNATSERIVNRCSCTKRSREATSLFVCHSLITRRTIELREKKTSADKDRGKGGKKNGARTWWCKIPRCLQDRAWKETFPAGEPYVMRTCGWFINLFRCISNRFHLVPRR